MENDEKSNEQNTRLYVEKKELLFIGAEFADNLSGIEVYLKDNNDHIGAIHYSKHTNKYSYHPDATKYMSYTPDMLATITSMIETAANNKKKEV
jgi:hypothetical protein